MFTITVPSIPPSNNKFMGNSHSFRKYANIKKEWHWRIKAAVLAEKKPVEPLKKATVTLRYYFPDKRRRDPDNYSGKFILDALVKEHIIIDDSFDVIKLELEAFTDKARPRTEIIINERKDKNHV